MDKRERGTFTKILAIMGTVLVWVPILAPVLFSALMLIRAGIFRMDYLMPAELFPVAFAGGILLLWAAMRARAHQKLVGWSLAAAVACLVAGQGLAVVTGLASGETAPTGWQWALVIASLVIYTLALVAMGIGGILLLRRLFKKNGGIEQAG